MARYAMVIDTTYCVGCNCCSLACKVENNIPEGVWWTRAKTVGGLEENTPAGTTPEELSMWFYTMGCQHCANPACVAVCPTGATWKDEETGIVRQDWEACIGCQACMNACPYEGVRTYNADEPAYFLGFATGDSEVPAHQAGVVEKCTFCAHRVARGDQPACVGVCNYGARYFGDLDDPESKVSQLLATRTFETLLPEQGTEPSVFFLK